VKDNNYGNKHTFSSRAVLILEQRFLLQWFRKQPKSNEMKLNAENTREAST
jgi:hypothetical protein